MKNLKFRKIICVLLFILVLCMLLGCIKNDIPTKDDTTPDTPSASSSLTKQTMETSDGATLSYWLYTPANATENMPLIVYLHGGSGKGDDLDVMMQNSGFPQFLQEGKLGDIPAYIVMPQASSSVKAWAEKKNDVRDLVLYCRDTYMVNVDKVSLTGHSMGGTGTWNIAAAFPELFSCVAPMSGRPPLGVDGKKVYETMPVWSFVGTADKIVPAKLSIDFIDEIKSINASAKNTVLQRARHSDVPNAYLVKEYDIVSWLISQ